MPGGGGEGWGCPTRGRHAPKGPQRRMAPAPTYPAPGTGLARKVTLFTLTFSTLSRWNNFPTETTDKKYTF